MLQMTSDLSVSVTAGCDAELATHLYELKVIDRGLDKRNTVNCIQHLT